MIWLLATAALAGDLRAPFGDADYGYFYPTAYKDHSGVDWACGSIRYSGHGGSDFGGGSWSGMSAGRDIVAAREGTVIVTNDGEFDECSTADCPGGYGYGNYVKIQHSDGSTTTYAHLSKGLAENKRCVRELPGAGLARRSDEGRPWPFEE